MSSSSDDFLAIDSPAVRDLTQQLRGLIRRVMPAAIQEVNLSSNIIDYSFDRTYACLICAITPYNAHVSLLTAHGATLPDPEHLLEGGGKEARCLRITTSADIEDPAVQTLLTSAARTRVCNNSLIPSWALPSCGESQRYRQRPFLWAL